MTIKKGGIQANARGIKGQRVVTVNKTVQEDYENAYLRRGLAIGIHTFSAIINTETARKGPKLRCTYGCLGGRGLRVAEDVPKGIIVAKGLGKLMTVEEAKDVSGFKIYDVKGKLLVLDAPTKDYPANLANTSDGTIANNCRLMHKSGTNTVAIKSVRPLKNGDEVIVPYGAKYTKEIRDCKRHEEAIRQELAKIPVSAFVTCMHCKLTAQKFKMVYDEKLGGLRHKFRIPCITNALKSQSK